MNSDRQTQPEERQDTDKTDDKLKACSNEKCTYRPRFCSHCGKDDERNQKLWELMSSYLPSDVKSIQKEIAMRIEYNLARTRFSLDNNVWYQAIAYSLRDRLIEFANDTRRCFLAANKKRTYYFSLEYLPGRSLKNALLNLELEENYRKALEDLGHHLEDLYDEEQDPGIGNGGLGRLASCFLDSAATNNFPVMGYGIRYNYGIFKQKIVDGGQVEVPDYWLMEGFPWEIRRSDIKHKIRFYGKVRKEMKNGKEVSIWEDGEEAVALAFDTLIPGFNTHNTLTLRLWASKPNKEFDLQLFNTGDYYEAVKSKQKAEFISSVLYPNDTNEHGKELRLAQQYFFVSASLQDLLWRFRVTDNNWEELPNKICIQLNDTHPAIAIVELLRLLVDEINLDMDYAWGLVKKVFAYTNHTVLPEALEKWKVDLVGKLLPRHLELIYLINHFFLEDVKKKYPNDTEKLRVMSIIEEGNPRMVSMPHLSIIGSHTVNGVSKIHSSLLKSDLFHSFYEMFPEKFQNKTNGVTHRRWIACANSELGQLYTDSLRSKDWLTNLDLIRGLLDKVDDPQFREKWNDIKQRNKKRLIEWIKDKTGVELKEESLFDVMIKRIHEYKRQFMNALYVAYRYLKLKELSLEERKKQTPRSVLIGGKAAPGYVNAKRIIKLINMIGDTINRDEDTKEYLNLVFLPNYSVTHAEQIIPAADICQHISTAGTEASGTSNMKFCMNGAILLGTRDGSNIEIAEEIGEENMVSFGATVEEVEELKAKVRKGEIPDESTPEAAFAIKAIKDGVFGKHDDIMELMDTIRGKNDNYLVRYDFKEYIKAQERIEELYKDREEWTKKSIMNALKSTKFTSDRTIREYAEQIWHIEKLETQKMDGYGEEIRKVVCHIEPHARLGQRTKEKVNTP